jgi:rhamnosyltransferase
MKCDASIVLLTLNGERYLAEVLAAIERQTLRPAQVFAIDSGSSDATLGILEQAGVSVQHIPTQEFGHGRTRNLAARRATGSRLVFLTQDASPANEHWLARLLAPLDSFPRVAGCYSRHIPRVGSDLLEASDLQAGFKSVRQVRTLPADPEDYRAHVFDHIRFSNSSSAYPKTLLLENPFDELLPMGEDQEWAKRMIERQWSIVYEPESIVRHSHDHTLAQKHARHYQMGLAFGRFLAPLVGRWPFPWRAWAFNVMTDMAFIASEPLPLSKRLRWLVRSPLHRAVTHHAYFRGWNSALQRWTRAR